MSGSAVLSPCGTYRYELTRDFGPGPTVVWVMLNPSTADAHFDDPTIRRVVNFSRGWGYGHAVVVNLFALRATDPAALLSHPDPVGPDNDDALRRTWPHDVVIAWGSVPKPLLPRITRTLIVLGRTPMCLGETKGGQPRHPLYVRGDARLTTWSLVAHEVASHAR